MEAASGRSLALAAVAAKPRFVLAVYAQHAPSAATRSPFRGIREFRLSSLKLRPIMAPMSKVPSQSDAAPPEVVPWRFSLRQMMVYVAILCVLLGMLAVVGTGAALALVVVVLVVVAHVVGTSIGTKLRDGSSVRRRWERQNNLTPEDPLLAASHKPVTLAELNLPTEQHLSVRGPAISRLLWFVALGATIGAGLGSVGLGLLLWQRITWAGLVVGGVSAGILGAWFAFLASSFYGITRSAWRAAVEDHGEDRRRQMAAGASASSGGSSSRGRFTP